jgi:hypothetical protein
MNLAQVHVNSQNQCASILKLHNFFVYPDRLAGMCGQGFMLIFSRLIETSNGLEFHIRLGECDRPHVVRGWLFRSVGTGRLGAAAASRPAVCGKVQGFLCEQSNEPPTPDIDLYVMCDTYESNAAELTQLPSVVIANIIEFYGKASKRSRQPVEKRRPTSHRKVGRSAHDGKQTV